MMSGMDEATLVINFTEVNLTKKMDLDMISDAIHYPKYHLHRIFSDTVGLTAHGCIQRRQLTESTKLLVFSCKPIVQTAFLSGYQNQQAFTNAFTVICKIPSNMYRENERSYLLQLKLNSEGSYEMLDRREKASWEISFMSDKGIPDQMELMGLTIDGFPHLNGEEYIQVLRQKISTRQALILKDGGTAIGIILFSYEDDSIDFMGSHPLYRKRGVPKTMLDKVMRELLKGKEISITTHREGDKTGTEYRKGVIEMGSAEAELLMEHGCPIRRFIPQQEEQNHE